MQPHWLAPVEEDGGSMLPSAGRISTGPYHMGKMAHPETGSSLPGGGGAFLRRTTDGGFYITPPFFRWPKFLGKSRVFI